MEIISQRLALLTPVAPVERWPQPDLSVVPRAGDLCLETISDFNRFQALEGEWTALFERFGRPQQVFQTFAWLAIWASLYVDGATRLSIVTGRIDGRLMLVWPLVVQTTLGIRILSGMGEPLSQYCDALFDDDLEEHVSDAAFDYVMALPVDIVSFRRVRDDAAIAPLLRRRLGAPGNQQAAPFVDFAGTRSTDSFDKRFSGKLRASRRRRRRRLEGQGGLSFVHHKASPEAATYVSEAIGFKREWARQTGVLSPSLRDPRFERFFVAAALAGPKAPDLRVSVLRAGAEILGIEISVLCKGRLFGHVLAPRPGFAQLGLGGILAEQTIVNALTQGYEAVDLLAPADAYKIEWTSASVGVGDYCRSSNWIGRLYMRLWFNFGRDALKTFVRRLQPVTKMLRRPRERQKRD